MLLKLVTIYLHLPAKIGLARENDGHALLVHSVWLYSYATFEAGISKVTPGWIPCHRQLVIPESTERHAAHL